MANPNTTACQMGNIDRRGQLRRLAMGILAGVAAVGGLLLTPPGLARIWLFLPLLGALLGLLQAQQRT